MERNFRWYDHITINIYWLGLNIATATITPVLLPFLVIRYVDPAYKNTYLATVQVVGLVVAMAVQPMAGMFSDRSTHRLGRRRPFMWAGTTLDLLFLLIIGLSPLALGASTDAFFRPLLGVNTAYLVLLAGIILLQFSSNIAHGALQGLIPDLVPEKKRGLASGVKAVMELLPSLLVVGIGPLLDRGMVGIVIAIIVAGFAVTMLVPLLLIREEPLKEKPGGATWGPLLRLLALAAIFVTITQGAVLLVRSSGTLLQQAGAAPAFQVGLLGLAGLVAMAGSIFLGVYLGAWVGIGRGARQESAFIWWVVNRLLFLAAVGSIRNFAQYFLKDVLQLANAATMTTVLMAAVAIFLLPAALLGGWLADRIGRRRLVAASGLIGAGGTLVLLLACALAMPGSPLAVSSTTMPLVLVIGGGCIIGASAGLFMATNWALGTDLVPPEEAGKYLGISNLAGAGAGIVGTGIGGPMADFFNLMSPGLGYPIIFAIYGGLYLLSLVALARVRKASA